MSTPALELEDVYAGYGRIEVLHGISLAVPVGSVFALLGPNGAGKSTTLQICSGKIRPTRGCPLHRVQGCGRFPSRRNRPQPFTRRTIHSAHRQGFGRVGRPQVESRASNPPSWTNSAALKRSTKCRSMPAR